MTTEKEFQKNQPAGNGYKRTGWPENSGQSALHDWRSGKVCGNSKCGREGTAI